MANIRRTFAHFVLAHPLHPRDSALLLTFVVPRLWETSAQRQEIASLCHENGASCDVDIVNAFPIP
jgi:hypothetical protein